MPKSNAFSAPKYRHYRPKNLGVVRLNGRDFYLGEYASPASYERYHRLVAEWLANGRQLPPPTKEKRDDSKFSVNEMLLAYWCFAQDYYGSRHDPASNVDRDAGVRGDGDEAVRHRPVGRRLDFFT